MKRSNFITIISSAFLAPFGIKAKPKYTIFKPNLEEIGAQYFTCWVRINKGSEPPKFLYKCDHFEIKCPPIPDDGKDHDVQAIRFHGTIDYYVDGKQVFV